MRKKPFDPTQQEIEEWNREIDKLIPWKPWPDSRPLSERYKVPEIIRELMPTPSLDLKELQKQQDAEMKRIMEMPMSFCIQNLRDFAKAEWELE